MCSDPTPKWPRLFVLLILCLFFFFPTSPKKDPTLSGLSLRSGIKESERTDAPLRLLNAEFRKVLDPATRLVPLYRLKDAEEYMLRTASRGQNTSSLSWVERGPNNVGGRSRALLIDRSDLSGNKVFSGGVGGGLWGTTNFKNATPSWVKVNDFFANLSVTCIKQSPVSNSIMYFGTGEGWGNIDAIQGGGIYKSVDGGVNWTLLSSSTGFSYVQDLEFDANGYIYASTRATNTAERGIMRSTDGGSTWVQVLTDPGAGITTRGADLERAGDGDMYATLGIFSTGHIFRSASNGTSTGISGSWIDITPSNIITNTQQRVELAVCPSDVNRIYAISQSSTTYGIGNLYRTDNDGGAWITLANASWCDQGSSTNTDFSRGQAWYDLILAVDPSNSSIVFAGGVVLVKSTNAGSSWTQATRWTSSASCTTAPVIHADIHEVTFLNSSEIYVATDGGNFYSNNGGTTYVDKNFGFNVTQYYGMALGPAASSNLMIAGSQDNGSHLFSTSGVNSVSSVTGGDGGISFIDSTNSSVWITSNPSGYMNIYRNNGTYVNTIGNGGGRFITAGDYAHNLNLLYFGNADGQYIRVSNIESGALAANINDFSTEMGLNRQVSCVKVDPSDETTIWLGCSDSENNTGTAVTPILLKVIRANNATTGGPSTKAVATIFTGPALPAGAFISNIDIEPGNSNHMILTVSNFGVTSVWESTNGGTNWSSIEGNLPDMPIRWALFIPAGYSSRGAGIGGVVLGTELGVWSTNSLNGSSTVWVANNNGLANVRVDQLVLRNSDKTLGAATHGRGVYTSMLPTSPLPVELTRFTGEQRGNDNLMQWQTASEYNSDRFELERSNDGINYEKISTLPAAGMSNQLLSYQYLDRSLRSEINYYRLRSIDINNEQKLSSVIRLQMKGLGQQLFVLGNPVQQHIRLRLFKLPVNPVQVSLYDISGSLIDSRNFPPSTLLDWQLKSSLPGGNYILNVLVDGIKYRKKISRN